MKVAGSSWVLVGLYLFLTLVVCVSLSNSKLRENSCASLRKNDWAHGKNLIEELAIASQEPGKILNWMSSDLTENYDATPFWYNLIQAIALASGITPTTNSNVHDLVTSSFSGDNLNSSLKDVLVAMECSDNFATGVEEGVITDFEVEKEQQNVNLATASLNFGDAVPSSPADTSKLEELGTREQEVLGNSLADDPSQGRSRRELKDRRRNSVLPDMHQPFFMSEAVPSSLVTRHPSIISISGCPSGHIQDLRGMCRQVFQYTVNYGQSSHPGSGNSQNQRPSPATFNPWLAVRRPLGQQPGSIKDLVRESSFFKHSIMRGYVPPFSFPRFQHGLNSGSPRPKPIMDTPLSDVRDDTRPAVEISNPQPKIVLMGTKTDLQSSVTLPQPEPVLDTNLINEMLEMSNKKAKGSGSSEKSDTSATRDAEKKLKKLNEEISRVRARLSTTTQSNNDDDD
ncbi:uncharacterized protein LOC108678788 [Hyalella azteca]|uniref:Uncharacterized protein LOC108678788 n=1 Tax=Hyalella azteca TaxID=294128 RepID=A0A8B7P9A9_HYAAZ|nr:uncharacterized protein LOC108678788 [Hyalella azteca]